jgi:hypothetical protein
MSYQDPEFSVRLGQRLPHGLEVEPRPRARTKSLAQASVPCLLRQRSPPDGAPCSRPPLTCLKDVD